MDIYKTMINKLELHISNNNNPISQILNNLFQLQIHFALHQSCVSHFGRTHRHPFISSVERNERIRF
jgi:hypothetical protein